MNNGEWKTTTVDDVRGWVDGLQQEMSVNGHDDEAIVGILGPVLEAIASGAPNPVALANEALRLVQ